MCELFSCVESDYFENEGNLRSFTIDLIKKIITIIAYADLLKLGIKRNPFSLNTCLIEVILKAMISSN